MFLTLFRSLKLEKQSIKSSKNTIYILKKHEKKIF